MYQPIWENNFKDLFNLTDGRFEIKHDTATRKELLRHLNDNLMQNVHHLSLMNYDEDIKLHKHELSSQKK